MPKSKPDIDQYRAQLEIDPDNLNGALEKQASLYYDVAEQYAFFVAERDGAKLELEETLAKVGLMVRERAQKTEAKVTEGWVQQQVQGDGLVMSKQREFLKARGEADAWSAMKEAFQQKSFMLRELVQLQLAQLHSLSVERGVQNARTGMADINRIKAGEVRRRRAVGAPSAD